MPATYQERERHPHSPGKEKNWVDTGRTGASVRPPARCPPRTPCEIWWRSFLRRNGSVASSVWLGSPQSHRFGVAQLPRPRTTLPIACHCRRLPTRPRR
ncbi:hypothetical protein PVAP13_4NG111257 [Panicum virgatum]|uniref:Uncharacterized protein n=1 Tax=Panicum virgatum TaxID=38727 RepID=A0A8T0T6P2_PANVG|nr:hypothetical protein PVAP13_4NG111257 [Panicum virgatum]